MTCMITFFHYNTCYLSMAAIGFFCCFTDNLLISLLLTIGSLSITVCLIYGTVLVGYFSCLAVMSATASVSMNRDIVCSNYLKTIHKLSLPVQDLRDMSLLVCPFQTSNTLLLRFLCVLLVKLLVFKIKWF